MAAVPQKREHTYKVLIIGDIATGKTSIVKRYVRQTFSEHTMAVLGVDFALKVLDWDNSTTIRLQLWDINGQDRSERMTRVYYRDAVGAFVVFDVTRMSTFDGVQLRKKDLDSKVFLPNGKCIPAVLLANKSDLADKSFLGYGYNDQLESFCKENGFEGWFETSAKENIGIEEAARFLVSKILLNKFEHSLNKVPLDTDDSSQRNNQGCLC